MVHYPVLIEFPTLDAANAWYDSPEYAPLSGCVTALTASTPSSSPGSPSPVESGPRPRLCPDGRPDQSQQRTTMTLGQPTLFAVSRVMARYAPTTLPS